MKLKSKAIRHFLESFIALPLGMGLGLFLFLYVFRAYHIYPGVSWSGHELWQRALFYGLVTAWCYLALQGLQTSLILRRFLQVLSSVIFIFLGLNYFWGGHDWTTAVFFEILWQASLVQLFFLGIWALFFKTFGPLVVPEVENFLHLKAENGKLVLSLRAPSLLFVRSAGNYLEVYYRLEGQTKMKLIRKSLKALEQDLADKPQFTRVHKQYLVNLEAIRALHPKGKVLEIDIGSEERIAVGTAYQEAFHKAWANFAPR